MADNTQPVTFGDLITVLSRRLRAVASSGSITEEIIQSMLNTALYDIHVNPGHNFPWAIRRGVLLTHAPYTTGSVDISASARTTVTGNSTAWNTAVTGFGFNNARAGGKMKFASHPEIYTVSQVSSDTSITLESRYTGDALDDASYTYFEDEYALASDFGRPLDLRMFSTDRNIPLIGPMEFRRQYPRNDVAGQPRVATIVDNIGFSGSTSLRPRVILAPYPNDEYSIPYNYITTNLAVTSAGVEQAQMISSTDEPIIPLKFRHVLVLHALYSYLRDIKNDPRTQLVQGEYNSLLARMAGEVNYGYDRPRITRARSARVRLGRFDVGGRFDQLRDR